MKTIVMSDLHGYLPDPKTFNKAEVMFICGDIVPLEIQRNTGKSIQWIYKDFLDWVNNLPVDKVFIIGGNHDFVLENFYNDIYEKHRVDIGSNDKLTYIIDPIVYKSKDGNEYTIKSMPYIENCTGWAFSTDYREIKEKCKDIFNEHFDILLSHDAPDLKPFRNDWGGDVIKESIVEAMKENNYPNYWFFGHIHDNPHTLSDIKYKTEMYNASIRNDNYEIVYDPLYIDIQKKPIAEDNGLVVSEYKDESYACKSAQVFAYLPIMSKSPFASSLPSSFASMLLRTSSIVAVSSCRLFSSSLFWFTA